MRTLLTLLLFSATAAFSQSPPPPDCTVGISLSTSGSTGVFDNRQVACQTWTLQYQATNVSAITVTFQSANGAVTAGSFGTYGGSTVTGANPMTNTTGENSTFSNGTVVISWVRVNVSLTASGGTATVNGTLYGYKTGYPGSGGGGGGGGCAGTVGTPCQIGVDNGGTSLPALGDATGKLLTGAYPLTAAISLSTSGLSQIIAASSGKTLTISHYSVGFASATNFQLEYGTGTNCGTGTTALTGIYQSIVSIAIDVPFIVPSGNALCVNLGSSVNGGGVIVYSQP
jgi:hypothetical protein